MRHIRRLAHALLAAGLTLGLGATGVVTAAPAPAQAAAIVVIPDAKKKTPKVTLTLAKATIYKGTAVKAKATVKYGSKKLAGKVAFYDGKKKLKTLTLKKGAASYTLPKTLKAGKHSIKVTYSPSKPAAKTYKAKSSVTKRLTVKNKPKITAHSVKASVATNPSRFSIGQSYTLYVTLSDSVKSSYPKPSGTATVEVFGFMDSQTYSNVPVVGGKATVSARYLTYAGPKTVRITFAPANGYYKKQTVVLPNVISPGPIITYF